MGDLGNELWISNDWALNDKWPEISCSDLKKFEDLFSTTGDISERLLGEIQQSLDRHSESTAEVLVRNFFNSQSNCYQTDRLSVAILGAQVGSDCLTCPSASPVSPKNFNTREEVEEPVIANESLVGSSVSYTDLSTRLGHDMFPQIVVSPELMPDADHTLVSLIEGNPCTSEGHEEQEKRTEEIPYIPFWMVRIVSMSLPFPADISAVKGALVDCKGDIASAVSRLCDEEASSLLPSVQESQFEECTLSSAMPGPTVQIDSLPAMQIPQDPIAQFGLDLATAGITTALFQQNSLLEDLSAACSAIPQERFGSDGRPPNKRRKKLTKSAVAVLEKWTYSHLDHPYPSREVKHQLAESSGLTEKQVSTWLTNFRKRQLASGTDSAHELLEGSLAKADEAASKGSQQMTPMESWLSSSDDEVASQENIMLALQDSEYSSTIQTKAPKFTQPLGPQTDILEETANPFQSPLEHHSYYADFTGPIYGNDYSQPSSYAESRSESSAGSAFSQCSDAVRSGPPRRGRKRTLAQSSSTHDVRQKKRQRSENVMNEILHAVDLDFNIQDFHPTDPYEIGLNNAFWNGFKDPQGPYAFIDPLLLNDPYPGLDDINLELNEDCDGTNRRHGQSAAATSSKDAPNFQCTFCLKTLSSKTWKRHEESQHLPRKRWTCMLHGFLAPHPVLASSTVCIFCDVIDPDAAHGSVCHRIAECLCRGVEERSFDRKDLLKQHLQKYHGVVFRDSQILRWRSDVERQGQRWSCGFCGVVLGDWDARATHIAAHFRDGLDMSSWDSNRMLSE